MNATGSQRERGALSRESYMSIAALVDRATEAGHAVRSQYTHSRGRVQPACGCGWIGSRHLSWDDARRELVQHMAGVLGEEVTLPAAPLPILHPTARRQAELLQARQERRRLETE